MGGRLALCLAMYHPRRFSYIILESASLGLRTKRERAERKILDFELAKKLRSVKLENFLLEWYNQPLFGGIIHHPDFNNLMKQRLLNDPDRLADSLSIMGTGNQPSFWSYIRNNKIPTLLLVGEDDLKFKNIAVEIKNRCSVATVNLIKQCGHNIHFEKPTEYVKVVKEFLIE
jgi:2-succinyl-6-hydroxy-2,4-cyclohexadiene-1-carboxylate synthase